MRERGTLLLSIALIGGLAVGSYWLSEEARRGDPVTRKLGHEVDYTADDLTLTRMDEKGRAVYTMDAKKLVHYADDDTGDLTLPHVIGAKTDRPEMTLRADRGKSTSDGAEVKLYGNVVLTRQPWRGAAALVAKGEYALAYPDAERFSTDQPIEIVRSGSQINANAMQYDNATQKVHFDGGGAGGRIREVLEPRGARNRAAAAAPVPARP